jgi:hypothetical protein
MGFWRREICKNCWEQIEAFVSTALDSKGTWVHVGGTEECAPTYAEPAE